MTIYALLILLRVYVEPVPASVHVPKRFCPMTCSLPSPQETKGE